MFIFKSSIVKTAVLLSEIVNIFSSKLKGRPLSPIFTYIVHYKRRDKAARQFRTPSNQIIMGHGPVSSDI